MTPTQRFWAAIAAASLALACTQGPKGPQSVVLNVKSEPLTLQPDPAYADPAPMDALELFRARAVRWNRDTLYICDSGNDRIRVVSLDLSVQATFGTKGPAPASWSSPRRSPWSRAGWPCLTPLTFA